MSTKITVSVLIPCYRSEKTLPKVIDEIDDVFKSNDKYTYQVVLVNDCSPDNTMDTIRDICKKNDKVIGVDLSRNFGQASAKLAALPYADGDVIIYMDDDGQHPASGIIKLADKILEGYDVVYAKFQHKQHSLFKRMTSRLHQYLNEKAGTKPKGIAISSFTAWSRLAVEAVKKYKSPFPSAGTFLYKVTTKIANVDIEHRSRIEGESGYNLKKLIALWLTSFTNFSIAPLRVSTYMGFSLAIMGFVFGIISIIRKILYPKIAMGYTSIMTILLFLCGIIMIMLGIIGEYIGRMYMTMCDMPQYCIRDVINYGGKKDESF